MGVIAEGILRKIKASEVKRKLMKEMLKMVFSSIKIRKKRESRSKCRRRHRNGGHTSSSSSSNYRSVTMKALINLGSLGRRWKPLPLSVPKPLVDFANNPQFFIGLKLSKQLEWLKCLLSSTRNEDFETKLQNQITCLCETEALGSAGSLAFAKEKLMDGFLLFISGNDNAGLNWRAFKFFRYLTPIVFNWYNLIHVNTLY
ncbi:hypothetical protein Syun_017153 [Stephania yunnanensis]|uniref:Uncharacterized protein n=1 Tax=Stephania yunnanensis TaxID=152371 RepID=A0AAP0J8N7_9MAGN